MKTIMFKNKNKNIIVVTLYFCDHRKYQNIANSMSIQRRDCNNNFQVCGGRKINCSIPYIFQDITNI